MFAPSSAGNDPARSGPPPQPAAPASGTLRQETATEPSAGAAVGLPRVVGHQPQVLAPGSVAFLRGRNYVVPEDVKALAASPPSLLKVSVGSAAPNTLDCPLVGVITTGLGVTVRVALPLLA